MPCATQLALIISTNRFDLIPIAWDTIAAGVNDHWACTDSMRWLRRDRRVNSGTAQQAFEIHEGISKAYVKVLWCRNQPGAEAAEVPATPKAEGTWEGSVRAWKGPAFIEVY